MISDDCLIFLGISGSSNSQAATNVSRLLSLDPGLDGSFDEGALFSSTQLCDVVHSTHSVSDNVERERSPSDSQSNEGFESDIFDDIENVDPGIVDRGYVNRTPVPGFNPALNNRFFAAGVQDLNSTHSNHDNQPIGQGVFVAGDQPDSSDGQGASFTLPNAAIGQGVEAVHGQGVEAVRGQGAEAVQGQGAEAVHGQGAEAVQGQGAEAVHGQGAKAVHDQGVAAGLPNFEVGQGEEHQEEEPVVNEDLEENVSEGKWLTYSELMLDSYPAKSKIIYLKAYKMFERYLKSQKQFVENIAPTEIQVLNYFHFLKHEKHLAPTTLWSTYSRVNACVKRLFGFSLKNFVRVSDVLKSYESGYKVKKASIFSPQEVLSIKVTCYLVFFALLGT